MNNGNFVVTYESIIPNLLTLRNGSLAEELATSDQGQPLLIGHTVGPTRVLAFAGDTHPALTTVRIDGNAIGRQAARFIVERAEGRAVTERVIDLGFSIVKRDSA